MKYRVPFIVGAAIGYVFGTKAGRERYEQIKRASRKVAENPAVQETAGALRTKSGELAVTAKDKAATLAGSAKQRLEDSSLGEKLPGLRHGEEDGEDEPKTDIPRPHSGTGATRP